MILSRVEGRSSTIKQFIITMDGWTRTEGRSSTIKRFIITMDGWTKTEGRSSTIKQFIITMDTRLVASSMYPNFCYMLHGLQHSSIDIKKRTVTAKKLQAFI